MNAKERYEYDQMMNALNSQYIQSSMQNIAGQQGLGNYSNIGSYTTTREMTRKEREEYLKKTMDRAIAEYENFMLDTPTEGPTMRFMNKHPSLKNAWEEMQTIWTLVGKK